MDNERHAIDNTEDKNLQKGNNSALIDLLCGCGRKTRYVVKGGVYSCNKYMRCPTYEELSANLKRANMLLKFYRAKRAVDGLNGRKWDASEHYIAEGTIEALEKEAT